MSHYTAFSPRIHGVIEGSTPWPVTLMITTETTYVQLIKQTRTNYMPDNVWANLGKEVPSNHVRHCWCNWSDLCSKLIPLWKISICITYISNVENYINIFQILYKLSSSIERTTLEIVVFVRAISFILCSILDKEKF